MNKNKIGMVAIIVAATLMIGVLAWIPVREFTGERCVACYSELCEKAHPLLFNDKNVAQKDITQLQTTFTNATPHTRKRMFAELKEFLEKKIFLDGGTLVAYKSFAIGALGTNNQCKAVAELRDKLVENWVVFSQSDSQKKAYIDFVNKKAEMANALSAFQKVFK